MRVACPYCIVLRLDCNDVIQWPIIHHVAIVENSICTGECACILVGRGNHKNNGDSDSVSGQPQQCLLYCFSPGDTISPGRLPPGLSPIHADIHKNAPQHACMSMYMYACM